MAGPVAATGRDATVLVRPMQVEGGPGVLVVLETDDGDGLFTPLSASTAEVVDQVQHSLLPPSLPLLPDVALSGSYHRASSVPVGRR